MTPLSALTQERVRALLDYNPETGIFRWRVSFGRTSAGAVTGSADGGGYLGSIIDGRRYKLHRVAWLHTHGAWPPDKLDHINGIRTDNRISNLRPCSTTQNHWNRKPNLKAIHGGFKGTYPQHTGRWCARIKRDGKTVHLGTYDTVQEAHAAYARAARRLFGEFARTE